jgi:hypothetical protein
VSGNVTYTANTPNAKLTRKTGIFTYLLINDIYIVFLDPFSLQRFLLSIEYNKYIQENMVFRSSLFPSYSASLKDMSQYHVWGESFLMFFFVILTTFALATVTLMDNNDSSSMLPALPALPSIGNAPKTGGKKHKSKH